MFVSAVTTTMSPHCTAKSGLAVLAVSGAVCSAPTGNKTTNSTDGCRYMPRDANWPSTQQWMASNETVGGQLIATVPLAAACHDSTAPEDGLNTNWPSYDEEKCALLQDQWLCRA